MSYIKLYDRIKELSRTQGTHNFELEGAVEGFSAFSDVYSDGDHLFYAITDGTSYEVGSGTFIYGGEQLDQIVRFPIRTSNSNNAVDFPEGIKEIYATYPATNAVYHNSGVADLQTPSRGGVTFWISENIIGYDNDIVWDDTYKRLGIRNPLPEYGIDVGGYGPESSIKASGLLVGNSGIRFFPASNGDPSYDGGTQLVHYESNLILDENTKTIVGYSGVVNQHLYFKDQNKGFVLAGPPSGCEGGCSPAKPFFRPLTLEDIPDLNSLYATDIELLNISGILSNYTTQVSGILDNKINVVSGVLYNYTTEVSGLLAQDILEVSGLLFEASGLLADDISEVSGLLFEASGLLADDISEVSGLLFEASGLLADDISEVSGLLFEASGLLADDISEVSGLLFEASGLLADDILEVSGLLFEASGLLADDILEVSGLLFEASGLLADDILEVSGLLFEASGLLADDISEVSGLLFEASGLLADDISEVSGLLFEASGNLFSGIEGVSGLMYEASGLLENRMLTRLQVDMSDEESPTESYIKYVNPDSNDAVHFRITSSGVGSRILLTNLYHGDADDYGPTQSGTTWGLISLNDGAYRTYNYGHDYTIAVTGMTSDSNAIYLYLDSGKYTREVYPAELRNRRIRESDYVEADVQIISNTTGVPNVSYPYGHILTVPTGSLKSGTSTPFDIQILDMGRNGFAINRNHNFGIDLDPQSITAKLDLRGDAIRIRHSGIVNSSSDPGYEGEIRWDANSIYVHVGTGWKKASLTGF